MVREGAINAFSDRAADCEEERRARNPYTGRGGLRLPKARPAERHAGRKPRPLAAASRRNPPQACE